MFDRFPDNVLVSPQSPPKGLVQRLVGLGREPNSEAWVEAAHLCLANAAWPHLAAMIHAGFNPAACHTTGTGDLRVTETLLHRCVRIHTYDELDQRIERLVALGADPRRYNAQGLSVLGLLCTLSRDMPTHRVLQALGALRKAGVTVSDPCGDGSAWARRLIGNVSAAELLANRHPETLPWVRQQMLEAQLSSTTAPHRSFRL